ncbi:hypothetical protein JX266_003761 [Neoarthrinium moseri]|uniref:uncharacterized protein n=1 Tax=Neoarthrinium moseri TaxID=1658444 RepID=UPI001FDE1166|nr:uncharacterized protein JN550_011378 [Neoarthrinium moseri]KAI1851096.1 hypothetical protein JX266_003761 [Neoarthrinium moseri]KAI1860653.1 hypothetical protein JN550_011378 [Neoarthrinium moseri]
MSNGPLPSTRCLLSALPTRQIGSKVRFLACVDAYSVKSAVLTLHHAFPQSCKVQASVDVKLLLQSLKSNQTDAGQWVHVIGYITSITRSSASNERSSDVTDVGVQALVLWVAEDLDLPAYEMSFGNNAK